MDYASRRVFWGAKLHLHEVEEEEKLDGLI